MNYFQYHGSSLWDERRTILEKAKYWGDDIKIIRYEKRANGEFVETEISGSWHFIYKDKLYYFLTNFHGQIDSFSELPNTNEQCLKEKCGVYFQFEILNNTATTTVANTVKQE